jgi:hypothetical protein
MKKKVAKMVLIMGIGLSELVMDIETSVALFNSIEYVRSENKIWLHIFEEGDLELSVDFDSLGKEDKLAVYVSLASILYN